MPTLKQALGAPKMKPEAKVVHLALVVLGEGTHTAADICAVLGDPPTGKNLGHVVRGAKLLRASGLVEAAKTDRIVASAAYKPAPRPAPATKKAATTKKVRAVRKGAVNA